MPLKFDPATFEASVRASLEHEIGKRVDAAIEEALEKLENELRASVAQVALNLLAAYDVSMDRDRVMITVRTDGLQK